MTANQQAIIKLIASYQLENPGKGIGVKELMNRCLVEMLAHTHKDLKAYLHEAKDHRVVIEKTNESGLVILSMPYNALVLEKIISNDLN